MLSKYDINFNELSKDTCLLNDEAKSIMWMNFDSLSRYYFGLLKISENKSLISQLDLFFKRIYQGCSIDQLKLDILLSDNKNFNMFLSTFKDNEIRNLLQSDIKDRDKLTIFEYYLMRYLNKNKELPEGIVNDNKMNFLVRN